MNYKDFLKIAKKIGDGGKCEVSIYGRKTKNAMLSRQDSKNGTFKNEWFILQNIFDGVDAKDEKGYRFSFIVTEDANCHAIDCLRPLAKKAPQKKTAKPDKKEWILTLSELEPEKVYTKKKRDDKIRKNPNMNLYAIRISKKYKVVRSNDFTLEEIK